MAPRRSHGARPSDTGPIRLTEANGDVTLLPGALRIMPAIGQFFEWFTPGGFAAAVVLVGGLWVIWQILRNGNQRK